MEDAGGYSPRTLREDLRWRGRLRVDECLEIELTLTSALEHLHKNGLVHRDVKPSNIVFVNGVPKLADIGLRPKSDFKLLPSSASWRGKISGLRLRCCRPRIAPCHSNW